MKKLLLMTVAAMAISSQAATVTWNSGALKTPTDITGAWSGTNVGNSSGFVQVWFFTSLADANAFVASDYTDATKLFASTVAGDATTKDTTASFGNYTAVSANSFALGTQYFTVAYAETLVSGNPNPAMNNTWYMYTGVEAFTTQGTGNSTINFLSGVGLGDASRAWPTNWTPVPEPATGMMALAGVAMLIRRRRRA